jgi:hypothetical protein
MGISVFPAPSAAGKTMFRTTLTSGTSYTVPAGVTYLNVLLVGGGGGSTSVQDGAVSYGMGMGFPGNTIYSTLTVTAGASIAYAIGAGGAGGTATAPNPSSGSSGGTTTFTGATSATGGNGGTSNTTGAAGSVSFATNQGVVPAVGSTTRAGGAGGAGFIVIEYWV